MRGKSRRKRSGSGYGRAFDRMRIRRAWTCAASHVATPALKPMAQPTKRAVPTGGCTKPMARLSNNIMPNWIGFMPILIAIGKNIGVRIRKAQDLNSVLG